MAGSPYFEMIRFFLLEVHKMVLFPIDGESDISYYILMIFLCDLRLVKTFLSKPAAPQEITDNSNT